MRKMVFAHALLPEGWAREVQVTLDGTGRIAAVTPDSTVGERQDAIAIPGLPNLHSHAFQRGMAGPNRPARPRTVSGPGAR